MKTLELLSEFLKNSKFNIFFDGLEFNKGSIKYTCISDNISIKFYTVASHEFKYGIFKNLNLDKHIIQEITNKLEKSHFYLSIYQNNIESIHYHHNQTGNIKSIEIKTNKGPIINICNIENTNLEKSLEVLDKYNA